MKRAIRWISSVDHKEIGSLYMGSAVLFLLIGGIEALLMRTQLAAPEKSSADRRGVQPGL